MKRTKSPIIRVEWPRVRRVKKNGRIQFLVDSRKAGYPGAREFFDSELEACGQAAKIARNVTDHGLGAFVELEPAQRRDAADALELLFVYDQALLKGHSPLLDAARSHIERLRDERASENAPALEQCLEGYLTLKREEHAEFERTGGKSGIAQTTIYEIESKARIIREHFAGWKITDIDRAAVEAFLRRLAVAPQTKLNIRTKLSQFLNFCRRSGWITANPVDDVRLRAVKDDVSILSVEEVERLLRGAESCDNPASVLPYIAVSLFAGLRPGEAQQLRWEQIHFETEQVEVLGKTSKTRESRFVHIEPTLAEWLLAYRHRRGRIIGYNFVEDWKAVRQRAGFTFERDSTRVWPVDVMRHCYGSYWLALHADRPRLAELMGNSVEVIKKNYRRAIPRRVAQHFWTLRPAQAKGKIVTMHPAA